MVTLIWTPLCSIGPYNIDGTCLLEAVLREINKNVTRYALEKRALRGDLMRASKCDAEYIQDSVK